MSAGEPIWSNPALGTVTYFDVDEETDKIILRTEQLVGPLLEANHQSYNECNHSPWGDGQRVARIPVTMLLKLLQDGVLEDRFGNLSIKDQPRFRRWLNDPENRFFRTRPGRV